jgi:uncharacterized protein
MEERRRVVQLLEDDVALGALRDRLEPRLSDDPGHDMAHCLRVAAWTLRLGGDQVDPREAVAAALLHDVVNLPKDSPERAQASELSARVAQTELASLGFTAAAIGRIVAAVRDHSFSRGATPEDALGRALQDADRLETLGAIGLMRCVAVSTQMGGTFFDSQDPWARARELQDTRYFVDHFFTKLLTLPETLCTEAGRTEARRRGAYLRGFLAQLADEIGEPAPTSGSDSSG